MATAIVPHLALCWNSLNFPQEAQEFVLGFSGRKGPKKTKRTGITSLGSPDLSSQSVSGLMTTLGSLGLSSQSVSGFPVARNGLG